MKNFEDRLKKVSRKAPSPQLDRRVEELLAVRPRRRLAVNVWWAAAACLLTGLVGFTAGSVGGRAPAAQPATAPQEVALQVVYSSPGSPNPFDLTSVNDSATTKPWKVITSVNQGDTL